MSERKDWNELDQERQPRRKHKKKSTFARIFLGLFSLIMGVCVVVAAYVGWQAYSFLNTAQQSPASGITRAVFDIWAHSFLNTAPQSPGEDIIVVIEAGSAGNVAAQLEELGLITDAYRFSILARIEGKAQNLQAGRFQFNTGWLPGEVLEQLVTGKHLPVYIRVMIPEGKTWWETGKILEEAGVLTFADFEAVITDPEFLLHHSIPFANAEGFLFPDTYDIPPPDELNLQTARSVLNRLVYNFWSRVDTRIWTNGRPSRDELKQIIILASIVEKETGVGGERATVAGVYANRLRSNVTNKLLQADPTVIYGLGPSFSGILLNRHTGDASNPYNTYQHPGLPPGPICSPGLAAIQAALNPEEHNYYYFVAKGTDNTSVFSTTLEQHNRAVAAYRRAIGQN